VVGERIRAEREQENIKIMTDPRKPTGKEVELHNLTHLPYRNWCDVCVAAKGKDLDHRRDVREARGLPEYSFDYCFPGNEFGYHLTILVGRERVTGMTMATVDPEKGSKGKFVADKVLEFITECGNLKGDIVIKTDQEPRSSTWQKISSLSGEMNQDVGRSSRSPRSVAREATG
jgi:hypothetical protein